MYQRIHLTAAVVAVVLTTACGTRIPHAKVVVDSSGAIVRVGAGATTIDGQGTTSTPGLGNSDQPVGATAPDATGAPPGAGITRPRGGSGGPGGSTTSPAAQGGPATAPVIGGTQASATRGARPSGIKTSTAAGQAKGDTSPISLGMIGSFSNNLVGGGPSSKDAILAWVKYTNANGGVNGHQLNVSVEDDQASGTVALQDARDLVENKNVIALVGNFTNENSAMEPYLRDKGVPIIGGLVSEDIWETSPIMFGGKPAQKAAAYAEGAQAVKNANGRIGVIYCVENATCATTAKTAADKNDGVSQYPGASVVYSVQSSVAQPDFTSECLAAQNNKVGYLFVLLDTASIGRVAASCARQGYRPVFASGINEDSLGKDPNVNNHYDQVSQAFTWTQTATASQRAYQAWTTAMNLNRGIASTTEWLAGALFARGMRDIKGPVTAAALIQGMYSIQKESIDGLLPGPVSYGPKGITTIPCVQTQLLKDGRMIDDFDGKAVCLPA
jgi:branched-chain amino acid transport system substrate-binding protein